MAAADFRADRERMVREQIESRGITNPQVLAAMRQVPRHEFVPEQYRAAAYEDHPLPIGHLQTISQPYIVALMTELLAPAPGAKVLEVGTGSGYQAEIMAVMGVEVWSIEIVEPLAAAAAARLWQEEPQIDTDEKGWGRKEEGSELNHRGTESTERGGERETGGKSGGAVGRPAPNTQGGGEGQGEPQIDTDEKGWGRGEEGSEFNHRDTESTEGGREGGVGSERTERQGEPQMNTDEHGWGGVHVKRGDGYLGWPEEAPFDGIMVTAGADMVPPPLIEQLKPGGRMVIPVGGPHTDQSLLLVEKALDGTISTRDVCPVLFVPLTREA